MMYNTTDAPNDRSYILEDKTNPTTISVNDEQKVFINKPSQELYGTDNVNNKSSTSNCSRFFDDFTKIRSQETLKGHRKNVRSLNYSNLKANKNYIAQNPLLSALKKVNPIQENKFIMKINDLLSVNNIKIHLNKSIFKINEHKWKEKEEELENSKLSSEEYTTKQSHIIINKGFIILFHGMLHRVPELTKTIYRL